MQFLRHTWWNILAVALGGAMVVVMFGGAELALRLRARLAAAPGAGAIRSGLNTIVAPHPRLSFQGKPSSSVVEKCERNGQPIYTATYRMDAHSRRETPVTDPTERECAALFLGCSFTFGTGVEDGETLPAQFGNIATAYHPVNAGFTGYGLQHVWLQLADEDFWNGLPFDKGVVVYSFIDHHINRLAGTPEVLNDWRYPLPWLSENNGQIELSGTFFNRAPLQYTINRYCRRLHFYRFLENRLGRSAASQELATEASIDFAARVIVDAAKKLAATRPGFQFWVLIFPNAQLGGDIIDRLRGSSVNYLDYARLLDNCGLTIEELFHKDGAATVFGHPKAAAYEIVARQLSQDIPPCE